MTWIASSRAPPKIMENLVQNNMSAVSNMSDADKRDLQKSVNNEMQKMKIQEGLIKKILANSPPFPPFPPPSFLCGWTLCSSFILTLYCLLLIYWGVLLAAVHNLTDVCFKKCVTANISNSRLERQEESCGRNCVERFLDANLSVIKHLENLRASA